MEKRRRDDEYNTTDCDGSGVFPFLHTSALVPGRSCVRTYVCAVRLRGLLRVSSSWVTPASTRNERQNMGERWGVHVCVKDMTRKQKKKTEVQKKKWVQKENNDKAEDSCW